MDKKSIELVQTGLAAFNEFHGPRYAEIRTSLLGRLSTNGQLLEGMREQEETNRRNYDLVSGFVGRLPQAEATIMGGHLFFVDDAHTARQIQANTLWVLTYNPQIGLSLPQPHYIIGARANTEERHVKPSRAATDLLIHSAFNRGLHVATLWNKELEPRLQAVSAAAGREYEPAELSGMFNPATGKLVVRGTPDALVTGSQYHDGKSNAPLLRQNRKPGFMRLHPEEIQVRVQPHRTITDYDIASFDIPTNLNKLAVAFDRVDVLNTLLADYGKPSPDTLPVEAAQTVE